MPSECEPSEGPTCSDSVAFAECSSHAAGQGVLAEAEELVVRPSSGACSTCRERRGTRSGPVRERAGELVVLRCPLARGSAVLRTSCGTSRREW